MRNTSITSLFEQQVIRTPDAAALRAETTSLTYTNLNHQANQFARYLHSLSIGEGCVVGVCVDRSAQMLITMLGILKAGAAYLPLDPEFPAERLHYMLENAEVALLVSQSSTARLAPDSGKRFDIQADWGLLAEFSGTNLDTWADAHHLAYMIYTSGSTGTPKGVKVSHGNVVNFLLSMAKKPGLSATDCLLAITTISFDIHVLELFLPLAVGASIRLISKQAVVDAFQLTQELEDADVSVMQATPATWRMAIAAGWAGKKNFKALIGGEAFPPDLLAPLYKRCAEVWNMYGPTETTVWSTCYRIQDPAGKAYIGTPIDNTQVYIANAEGGLAAENEEGELYIGGAGVTLGYHKLEQMTRQRFIVNPFVDGAQDIVYRTGDLARFAADGNLEHLGRLDDQIKIRGYRIELGDVEAAVGSFPAIEQAVVVAAGKDSANSRLIAFYSAPDGALDREVLRAHCASKLPAYMIPQGFVYRTEFPLTPNGKVDRKQLAASWSEAIERGESAEDVPACDFEKALLVAWQKVLQNSTITVTDTFVDAGGVSISAFELIQEMEIATGVKFPLEKMLENPTIRDLRRYSASAHSETPTNVVPLQPKGEKSPIFCLCGVNLYQELAASMGEERPTYGIYSPIELEYISSALAGVKPKISVSVLAQRYCKAILRKGITTPHFLVGFSFGGLVAIETAQLLREQGKEVAAVILLDSILPNAINSSLREKAQTELHDLIRRAKPANVLRRLKRLRNQYFPSTQPQTSPPKKQMLRDQAAEVRNRAYDDAAWEYIRSGKRYTGKVVLIKASDSELVKRRNVRPDYGWSDVLEEEPVVHRLEGKHLDIIQGSMATKTATILQQYLTH